MVDVFSKEKRSEVMSGIKGKNTRIEEVVRKQLFKNGFRYRKNDERLPGKPDIVIPKLKTVIFVNGCFWHGHQYCKYFIIPKTRVDFWTNKINGNIKRDKVNEDKLKLLGWNIVTIWECELKINYEARIKQLINELYLLKK